MIKRLLEEWPEKKFLSLVFFIYFILSLSSFFEQANGDAFQFKINFESSSLIYFIKDFFSAKVSAPFIADGKISTFRPLTALTHIFDFIIIGEYPKLWRVHSWLWTCLFLAGCYLFIKNISIKKSYARLALLILACNFRLIPASSYVIARGTIIAGFFSILALNYFITEIKNNPNPTLKDFQKTLLYLVLGAFTMEYSLYIIPVFIYFIVFSKSYLKLRDKAFYISLFLSLFFLWFALYNFYDYGVKNLFYYMSFTEKLFFKKALLMTPFYFVSTFFPTPLFNYFSFNPHFYQMGHFLFYTAVTTIILIYVLLKYGQESQTFFFLTLLLILSFGLASAPIEWRNFLFSNVFSSLIFAAIICDKKSNKFVVRTILALTFFISPLYALQLSIKNNKHFAINNPHFWPSPYLIHKTTGKKLDSPRVLNYMIYSASRVEAAILSAKSSKIRFYSNNLISQLSYQRIDRAHETSLFRLKATALHNYVQIDVTSLIPLEEFELKFYNFEKKKWDSYELNGEKNLVLTLSTLPLTFF